MKVSEKKVGCLDGIKRENGSSKPCAYIEGSVTKLKSGMREVSIINDEVVLWIMNDVDITITAEDIASVKVSAFNGHIRNGSTKSGEATITTSQCGVFYNIQFTNGESGILKVKTLELVASGKEYETIAEAKKPFGDYVAAVAGWLNPEGKEDEKYDSILCPGEGYTPVISYYKALVKKFYGGAKLAQKLGLPTEHLNATVKIKGVNVPYIKING